MEIKFHPSTKTYSFGGHKYLTLVEAQAYAEKHRIATAQLFPNETLVTY